MTNQETPLSEIAAILLLLLIIPTIIIGYGYGTPPVVEQDKKEVLVELIPVTDKEQYETTIRELQTKLFNLENDYANKPPVVVIRNRLTHIVQPGENLSSIARKYKDQDATVQNLIDYNKENVQDIDNITPGQMLTIYETDDFVDSNDTMHILRSTYEQ